jgi:hypothetical protein
MYASGENVINLTTVDGAEIILYAQWKLKNLVKIHTNNAF